MQVILQQEVANLGKVGHKVSVKPGYARNYLLPQNMAVLATEKNIAEFEARRAELEKAAQEVLANAKSRAAQLSELTITIQSQAGDEGKLFGSIGPRDVADAANKAGIELAKKEVLMPEGPIRQVGEHMVNVKLHSDVSLQVKIQVVPLSA